MHKLKQLSVLFASLAFFALCFISVYFYKDRFYADSAYFFFHAVNSGWFHIEHGRLLLGFSQLFPIVTSNLGLPLQFVMASYSLGIETLYFFIFLFLVVKMKDYQMGMALILIHLIGQLWLFHVPSLEICHGAALSILFYSILKSNKWISQKWLLLLLLLEWLVLFSHPVNFVLIGFVLLWHIFKQNWDSRIHLQLIALWVIGFLTKWLTISAYDKAKLENSERIISNSFFNNTSDILLHYYPDLLLILFITLAFLLIKKQLLKGGLVAFSCLGLLLVVNRIEPLMAFNFYTEVLLTPFVFIVVFSFSESLLFGLNTIKLNASFLIIAFGIISLRLFAVIDFSAPFIENSDKMDSVIDNLQQREGSKYYITKDATKAILPLWNWASPIESILFSAIDGSDNTISLSSESDLLFENNKKELKDSMFLLRRFDVLLISSLNERYFELKKESYVTINSSTSIENTKDIASATKIKLKSNESALVLKASDTIRLKINIQNSSDFIIPSGEASNCYISYHWLDNENKMVLWDGIRTPPEIDLIGEYEQYMKIATPSLAGTYFLKPDIVIEGREWFNLEEKYSIIVK